MTLSIVILEYHSYCLMQNNFTCVISQFNPYHNLKASRIFSFYQTNQRQSAPVSVNQFLQNLYSYQNSGPCCQKPANSTRQLWSKINTSGFYCSPRRTLFLKLYSLCFPKVLFNALCAKTPASSSPCKLVWKYLTYSKEHMSKYLLNFIIIKVLWEILFT